MEKKFNSLEDWLNWQQTLHPKNIDFKLERIKSVYRKLNLPKIAKKIITIAGTNGKGSTVALLESILCENGYNVGAFTSPHLLNYNERIKINKKQIETKKIIEAFEIIESYRKNTTLTYFEFATLSAFYLFEKSNLDYVILEVGLGGRLDATNIIDSDLSIITSIGIDHTEFLGSTIKSIALEKAGVMRSFCCCIYAQENPPSSLISYAKKKSTNFIYNDNDFKIKIYENHWSLNNRHLKLENLSLLPLIGNFQYNHAASALMALYYLEPNLLKKNDKINKGLQNVELKGRYEIISEKPEIILDVAHNADASKQLSINLSQNPIKKTIALVGILKDKDVYSIVEPMKNIVDEWYCATINNERGMNGEEIEHRIRTIVDKKNVRSFPSINKGYNAAIKNLHNTDRLVVYGSFYTVSEIMKIVKHNIKEVINN